MNNSVPVVLNGGHNLEDMVAKMDFATGINPRADLAHNLLVTRPDLCTFHIDYIKHPNGSVELTGICMETRGPTLPEQAEAIKLLQEYFKLAVESKELKGKRSEISSRVGMCEGDYDKCYNESRLAFDDYCDACKAKTPISKQIKANASRRVAIMNSL